MSIPALLSTGLLPAGLHEATLEEVAARFGSANDRRLGIQHSIEEIASIARTTGLFVDLIVDGSYVTDKELPDDADLILRTGSESWTAIIPLSKDPVNAWLTDVDEVRRRYRVQAFIDDAGSYLIEFFSTLKPEDALQRGLHPMTQRGLIRVPL